MGHKKKAIVTKEISPPKHVDDLRQRAEKKIQVSMDSTGEMSAAEIQKVIHELHVHQIELEMQNEALRKSHMETAESQYKYSDLYDFAPVGYFTLDKKGHIIEANVTGASLLGAEKRSLAKQPFQRFIIPGYFSIFQSHLQKAHELRSKLTCKLKLTGKDGSLFDALIDTIAVIDGEDKFDHYRSSVTDITEITGAEEAMREAEEGYRALASTVDSMYLVDRECRYQFMNDAHLLRLGVSLDQVKGRSYGDFHSEEDLKQFAATIEAVFETRKSLQTEHKGRIGDSFFLRTFSPVRYPQGSITAVTVISKDITERKRAEEALYESRERYRSLFENMLDGYAYCRLLFEEGRPHDFIYLDVNTSFEKLTGLKNVIGRKVSDVIPGIKGTNPKLFEIYGRVAMTGKPERFETYLDSLGIWLYVAVYSPGKNHFVAVFDNVTERKRADEAIKASHQQLRALARRLQSAREDQRKQIAREIHDELGGALTGLKIDLSFLASSAPKSRDKTKRDSFLGRMLDMTNLIDETIGTVRKLVTELRPSILDDLGLLAALEWQLEEFQRRTGVQCKLHSTMAYVNLDEERSIAVFRIFQESLTNVARHANATKVTATLYKEADSLVLKVEDNGKGISEDDIHNAKSVGLVGMSERALFLRGTVNFSGEPSKGTTVSLQFPFGPE